MTAPVAAVGVLEGVASVARVGVSVLVGCEVGVGVAVGGVSVAVGVRYLTAVLRLQLPSLSIVSGRRRLGRRSGVGVGGSGDGAGVVVKVGTVLGSDCWRSSRRSGLSG